MADPVAPSQALAAPGQLYNAPSGSPTAKVTLGGLSGLITTVLIWIWSAVQKKVPELPEMTPEIAAALVTVASFAAAYFTHDRKPSP